jgi:hypothetical protein
MISSACCGLGAASRTRRLFLLKHPPSLVLHRFHLNRRVDAPACSEPNHAAVGGYV